MEALIGIGAFLVIILAWAISLSNRFARLDALVKESWADVDVALKRRHDLIPNLVETVKAYAAHEKEVFDRVARAREGALANITNEGELARSVNALLARAEAYPQLKSSHNFLQLQQELVDTEDRIAAARRFYNANVRDFNICLESFPSSLFSGGRTAKQPFEADSIAVRQAPTVRLD